jgi:flavin reductase
MLNATASTEPDMPATAPETGRGVLEKNDYRNAMSRLGAAVNIIATDGPAGRAGFTASAVCSVTDEPPTLLVCLNRTASVYPAFEANGVLCVNVLAPDHQELSGVFGGKTPMEQRFAAARWHDSATGSPVLVGAAVSFDCRVARSTSVGTHDVLFCEVLAVYVGEAAHGLIYFDRRYHGLVAPDATLSR